MAVIQPLDIQRLAGIHHRRLGYIFRLIHRDRRQCCQHFRHLAHQLSCSLMRRSGDFHQRKALRFHMSPEPLQIFGVGHDVHLVGRHDLGTSGKIRAVLLELGVDGVKVRHRVPPLAAGYVYHVYQQAAAVDVAQEVVAEARTVRRALDDAGNVRHHEAHALVDIHDAEVGVERGEVVVGDLRPRLGNDREQRRFADVGEADEAHVREQLEL